MLELATLIGRVDVHQNGAGRSRRELRDHPLRAVRAPDPDAVAAFDAEGEQASRNAVDRLAKRAIGVAEPLVTGDQCIPVGVGGRDAIEAPADRFAEQGNLRRAADLRVHQSRAL